MNSSDASQIIKFIWSIVNQKQNRYTNSKAVDFEWG